MSIALKCDCCGIERVFTDNEHAFREGWDAPPHFSGYIACDLCPASLIVLGQKAKHDSVHALWEVNGRPTQFSQETCLASEDRVSEAALDAVRDSLGALLPDVKDALIKHTHKKPR